MTALRWADTFAIPHKRLSVNPWLTLCSSTIDRAIALLGGECLGILVAEFTDHHDAVVDLAFVVDDVGVFEAPGAIQRDEMRRGNGGVYSH